MILRRYRRKAIFLHIQKTAGTSAVKMARTCYGRKGIVSHDGFERLTREECERIPFLSGHFGYAFAKPFMHDRYAFTFLREPNSRIVSLYDFCRRKVSDNELFVAAQNNSLEDFLRLGLEDGPVRPWVWNFQVRQMAGGYADPAGSASSPVDELSEQDMLDLAIRHAKKVDFVGFKETFEADIEEVFGELASWRRPRVRKDNVTNTKMRTTSVSDQSAALLEELTQLDAAFYQHMWAWREGGKVQAG